MSRFYAPHLLAAALMLSAGPAALVAMPTPALAQEDWAPSFDSFHDRLAPYGRWFETERWGYVWQPEGVGSDFRPYYNGHWVYTDQYGWYWESDDDDWGDIVYHYGRWAYDPDEGWLWVPGYVWGPAWVIWREGDGYSGWLPMPPDENFYSGDEPYQSDWGDSESDYYGYSSWYGPDFGPTFYSLWLFVPDDHFGDRHFHRWVHEHRRDGDRDRWRDHDRGDRSAGDLFRRTHDATHYRSRGGFVFNRGIDPERLSRATGQRIVAVPPNRLARPSAPPPLPIDRGRAARERQLRERPNLVPRRFREGGQQRLFRTNPPSGDQRPARGSDREPARPVILRPSVRQPAMPPPQGVDRVRGDGFGRRGREAPPPVSSPPPARVQRERLMHVPPPSAPRAATPPAQPRGRMPPPARAGVRPASPPPAAERRAPPPREDQPRQPRGEGRLQHHPPPQN